MNESLMKQALEDNYPLKVTDIISVRSAYKVICGDSTYCLKTIKYEYGHFLFIISAMKHLERNGFEGSIPFVKTKEGKDFIVLEGRFAYLSPWKETRLSNYESLLDVLSAAEVLAKLHIKSRNFAVTEEMKPRIGWFKWIETFLTRKDEILDFKNRILKKEEKTEFDCLYLSAIEEEVKRAEQSVGNLLSADYIERMEEQVSYRGFCHHDFAHHNLLFDADNHIFVIDFDYCILDTHLHDLSSLLLRKMKNGKWDLRDTGLILDKYSDINRVYQKDIPIMAAFMEFPQDFWQVGIQYYWEKQPWEEEFFIGKLNKIIDDVDEKQEFIEEFRRYNIGG